MISGNRGLIAADSQLMEAFFQSYMGQLTCYLGGRIEFAVPPGRNWVERSSLCISMVGSISTFIEK